MKAPCGQEDCDCGHTIARLVTALKAAQWRGGEPGEDYCPVCLRDDCAGHEGDCIVGIALTDTVAAEEVAP